MNTSVRFCSMAALCAALSACKVGPDYHRPAVPMPTQYKELAGWTAAAPADAAPKGDWWTDFHDPLLDQLEPMVEVSNQTVRQNYANYEEALAEVKVARSQLFPTLGITGSATRSGGPGLSNGSGISTTTGTSTGTGTTTGTTSTVVGRSGSVINAGSLEANASWTLDLWGKVRRLIEENKALAQADEATLVNATLSEQTLLATTVIELRLTAADIDLQQKTVDPYRDSLRVTEEQAKAGITATPPSAVITARVAWETAQANLVGFRGRPRSVRPCHCGIGRQESGGPGHSAQHRHADAADSARRHAVDPAAAPARYRCRRAHHGRTECRGRHCSRGVLPHDLAVGGGGLLSVTLGRAAARRQSCLVHRCVGHRDGVRLRRAPCGGRGGAGSV